MKQFFLFVMTTAVAVVLFSCSEETVRFPAENRDISAAVERLIQDRIDRTGITGLTAAVVHNGVPVVVRGFGARDEAGNPVTAETLFQIGSVTKVITALAVMNLVEEGRIDLDVDVREYLPEFRPLALGNIDTTVTVRNLLTHHSGIPNSHFKDFTLDSPSADAFMSTSRELSEEYLVWDPGMVFAYNNAAFSLLGELVATVSGVPYVQYITETVFGPLGMEDARVYLSDREHPGVSGGFTAGEPEELYVIKDLPAGSMLFSARDMQFFLEELLASASGVSDVLLEPETLRSMFIPQNGELPLDGPFEIGLTFWIDSLGGSRTYGHGGTLPPFHSEMRVIPGENLGIFLATNDNVGDNFVLTSLLDDIAGLFMAGEEPSGPVPVVRPSTAEERAALAGHYAIGGLGMASFETREDQVFASIPSVESDIPVVFQSDGSIALGETGLTLTRSQVRDAEYFAFDDRFFLGPVVSVSTFELSPEWDARTGRYLAEGQFFDAIELSHDQDAGVPVLNIEVRTGQRMTVALKPVTDTLLRVQGYGRNVGNIIEYRVSGPREILRYSGIEFVRE